MALKHANPLEVIDLHVSDAERGTGVSSSLLKTAHLQLMQIVLSAGHSLPEHQVPGEVTIHCIAGAADIVTPATTCRLTPGTLVMLPAAQPHSVRADTDSMLLVTVLLP